MDFPCEPPHFFQLPTRRLGLAVQIFIKTGFSFSPAKEREGETGRLGGPGGKGVGRDHIISIFADILTAIHELKVYKLNRVIDGGPYFVTFHSVQ